MIKDIINQEGHIDQIFMIKQATKAIGSSGSYYFALTLQDNSGTLEARKWGIDDNDLLIIQPGELIRVDGMMQNYKGHPQLKINSIDAVDDSQIDLTKYIPSAPCNIDKMKAKLDEFIEMIEDKDLHDLTYNLIHENYENYTKYPAAVTVHHAYLSGLLFHSLSICAMALKVQEQYKYLQKDYLIVGSLLHDIGKTKELSGFKAVNYTTEGNLIGHITMGAMMVHEKGSEMKIDDEKLAVLTHMILAHHGKLEFGSPKTPMTAEAFVLHTLDELDSKLELLRSTYTTTDEGDFTGKIVWLDSSNFFKPHKLDEENEK